MAEFASTNAIDLFPPKALRALFHTFQFEPGPIATSIEFDTEETLAVHINRKFPKGRYEIITNYLYNLDSLNRRLIAALKIDDVQVGMMSVIEVVETNDFIPSARVYVVDLPKGVHDIDLVFGVDGSNVTGTLYEASISLKRVG